MPDSQVAASSAIAKQQEPLIVNGDVEAQARAKDKVSYSSLPNKKQLAILCIARLADPLAASSIQVRTTQKPSGDSDEQRHTCSTNSGSLIRQLLRLLSPLRLGLSLDLKQQHKSALGCCGVGWLILNMADGRLC
jgi:hypothetical protein